MPASKACFEAGGFECVVTYIQSSKWNTTSTLLRIMDDLGAGA